jgi:ABC-type Na+ efflux pump permease subunit
VLAVDGLTWQPSPIGQGVLTRQLPAMPAPAVVPEPEKPPPPPPLLVRPATDYYRPPRPPIDDRALLWKELHAEPLLGMAEFGALITVLSLMLLAILGMIFLVAGLAFMEARQFQPDLGGYLNTFLRPMTASIGTCCCFGVGIVASAAVSREIERRTLDGLLTLPVSVDEILFAKLLGAGYALRGVAWNLAVIWLLGLLTGGFHLIGLVLLILATMIHSAFFATLGLWLSTICRSTTRALLLTALLSLVLLIVPWLTEGQFNRFLTAAGLEPGAVDFLNLVQGYLTPTVAQYRLGFALSDSQSWSRIPAILVSLLIYGLMGGGLWIATRRRLTDTYQ